MQILFVQIQSKQRVIRIKRTELLHITLPYTFVNVHTGIMEAVAISSFICCVLQIPKDILLEVLGPSKVYKQVIKELINSAVAGYVEKVSHKLYFNLPKCFQY